MDSLNQKIVSSFDKNQDRALVSGVYGFNTTSGKWNYVEENGSGALSVDVHGGSIGSGDVKARTNPADPNTSQFLKCNANNHLKTQIIGFDGSEFRDLKCDSEGKLMTEITAEIQAEGLATEAKQDTIISNQTSGLSKVQVLGNTEGDGSGTSVHLHTDATGNVLVKEVGTVNVAPADSVNSGTQNDPANSVAVGLRGRTNITDASTETFLLCDTDGHLQVDTTGTITITGDTQIKAEDDTASARNIRCNNSGHVKSQLIGNTVGDGSGTNKVVQTNDAGQLKVKLIAEDNTATRREVRCNTIGHLQTALLANTAGDGSGTIKNVVCNSDGNLSVKADITNTSIATTTSKTTTTHNLYAGGAVSIGAGSTVDFVGSSATIGTGTANQLNVSGLGTVEYIIEGAGTSPSLNIHQLVGSSASPLVPNQNLSQFSNDEDFAVFFEGQTQHRGLRIKNTSGSNSFTVSSITAVYIA